MLSWVVEARAMYSASQVVRVTVGCSFDFQEIAGPCFVRLKLYPVVRCLSSEDAQSESLKAIKFKSSSFFLKHSSESLVTFKCLKTCFAATKFSAFGFASL